MCMYLCYILDERVQLFCVRYRVNMAMAGPQRERSRYTLTNYKHMKTALECNHEDLHATHECWLTLFCDLLCSLLTHMALGTRV